MPRALVIGGGVAGPAAAMFLAAEGWDVEIFEAAAQPNDYAGAFLNIATNGLTVLEALGLRDRLLSDAHPAPHMIMWSSSGKQLGSVPNGPAGDAARGSAVVRRGWLHRVLREGAESRGIPIKFGARLTTITAEPGAVHATFADGRGASGDVLIGCDGIGAPTRTYIDPNAPAPRYSGLVGLGGFARVPELTPTPATQHFLFGRRSFFGYLVRADGTIYWFANITAAEPARDSLRDISASKWLDRLRGLHEEDPYPVPQIIDGHTGELGAYPIYDLSGVPHWSRGRVVAVGDAVHATSPSAGQGASLALEDAQTLALCLREEADHLAAFARYQAIRQPRADKVVNYARKINSQKRVSTNRVAVAIRDAMLPLFLKRAANDRSNDWLYNYRVTEIVPLGGKKELNAARIRERIEVGSDPDVS